MDKPIYAVVMAGGKGERFWPLSRDERPKQFLSLFSPESLLEQTVSRIASFVPEENILVITNLRYVEQVRTLLPNLRPENIIGEPVRRDTAPCVALAAGIIMSKSPDAVMLMFPADHSIVNISHFKSDLQLAMERAAEKRIVTIGIPPAWPSSDYGYIEAVSKQEKVSTVRGFREKPSHDRAEDFLSAGNYFWNSGIFVWNIRTIYEALCRHTDGLGQFAEEVSRHFGTPDFSDFLSRRFAEQEKISIDYAVMEKVNNIEMIQASFDWDDVGNWSSLRNHLPSDSNGNISVGTVRLLDSFHNIVFNRDEGHLVAGIDLEGLTVVHTGDATLICRESSGPKLKQLLKTLASDPSCLRYL